MEFYKMNLYTLWHNNSVFKNRRDSKTRKALTQKAIDLTLKDGIDILESFSFSELENMIFEL